MRKRKTELFKRLEIISSSAEIVLIGRYHYLSTTNKFKELKHKMGEKVQL